MSLRCLLRTSSRSSTRPPNIDDAFDPAIDAASAPRGRASCSLFGMFYRWLERLNSSESFFGSCKNTWRDDVVIC